MDGSQTNLPTLDFRHINPIFSRYPNLPTYQPEFLKIDQGIDGWMGLKPTYQPWISDTYTLFFSMYPNLPTYQPEFLKIDQGMDGWMGLKPTYQPWVSDTYTRFFSMYPNLPTYQP